MTTAVLLAACSASPGVEVVAQDPIVTTTTTSTGPVAPPPVEPAPATVPAPSTTTTVAETTVDVEQLAGLISADLAGQHIAVVIDGVHPVEDDDAWLATWQALNGRLLADHLDEQPPGLPPGAVIAGAPTVRTEQRYRLDGLGSLFGASVQDNYTMLVELPGVTDPVVAAEYINGAVAEAVLEVIELPNRRSGAWSNGTGAYVELSGPAATYEISVVESVLASADIESRPVLVLDITRVVPVGDVDGFDPEGPLFTPLQDPFDRLELDLPREVSAVSRVVAGSTYDPAGPARSISSATLFHPDVDVDDLDPLLDGVADTLDGSFERDDQYLAATGEIWFQPVDRITNGPYVFEHVGSGLDVAIVGQDSDLGLVESEPPAQRSIIGDAGPTGAPGATSEVIEFDFDGLTALDVADVGPAVTTLSNGRSAAVLLAEDHDIAGMDPPILVADAPITYVGAKLHQPVFDPDSGALLSAVAYEVEYSQAVEIVGDVRETQLEIQAALIEVVEERFPGEPLSTNSYEVVDGIFEDGVTIGGGFPQRLTVSIGPLDPQNATPTDLRLFVRRYSENPDATLLGPRSDWISDDLTALIGILEPVSAADFTVSDAQIELDEVSSSRFASGDGETALVSSGAQLNVSTPDGPTGLFSPIGELIGAAGYDENVLDDETSSFRRPESDRSDRFLVLGGPDDVAVIIDSDSAEL